MKNLKKMLSLLMVLALALSMLPLAVCAEELDPAPDPEPTPITVTATAVCYTASDLKTIAGTYGTLPVQSTEGFVTIDADTFGRYITYNKKMYEFKGVLYNDKIQEFVTFSGDDAVTVIYVPHTHRFSERHNRLSHWLGCRCGQIRNKEPHVDPATDDDKICTCGYKFSSNTDLTTLWLTNVRFENKFSNKTSEYTANVTSNSRNPVTSRVIVRTFDALATVDAPKTVEIGDGIVECTITVTAEDKTTTRTITILINRPEKVENVTIGSALGENRSTSVSVYAKLYNKIGSASIPAGAADSVVNQVAANDSTQVIVNVKFSHWSARGAEVTIPGAFLKAIAEETETDLVVRTPFTDVIVSHEKLAKLDFAKDYVFSIARDGTTTVSAGGEEVADLL